MTVKVRLLFICAGNSARSQMAEGFARYYGGDAIEVGSAGTQPVGVNPNAVWAMNEVGIDISHQSSDLLDVRDLETFNYIITLCGDARDSCPLFPSHVKSEHWPLGDPAKTTGEPSDVIGGFRVIRYQIERRVRNLLRQIEATGT